MKKRKMPDWLAQLREKNPSAYLEACRRGGKRSAEVQKKRRQILPIQNSSQAPWEEQQILAGIKKIEAFKAARSAAWQRRDHLLPPEETDLGND